MKNFKILIGIVVIAAIIFSACPGEDDDPEGTVYTIVFDGDGGTVGGAGTKSVTVVKDEKVTPPVFAKDFRPTTAGLYPNAMVPAGWLDADGNAFDPEVAVTKAVANPVKAQWDAPAVSTAISGGAGMLTAAVTHVKANAGRYVLGLAVAQNCSATDLDISNVDLTIVGIGVSPIAVNLNGQGSLFVVGKTGTTNDSSIKLTIDNVVLTGGTNTHSLVQVRNQAVFTMLTGSKITANESSANVTKAGSEKGQGAALHVGVGIDETTQGSGGTFYLKGGEISGNKSTSTTNDNMVVGGLLADSSAKIYLESGKIAGNKDNNNTLRDIFCTHTVTITMSGDVEVEEITLNATSSTATGSITLSNYDGVNDQTTTINLRSGSAAGGATYWNNNVVLKGATVDSIELFTLGKWFNNSASGTNISGYILEATSSGTVKVVTAP